MTKKSGLADFWTELRRRRVVRTGGVYMAAAFVVLQTGEIILPAFNTPDWALQSLVVLAVLGLPVVLTVAWVYDMTPHGLERTQDTASYAPKSLAPRLAFLVITSVAVGFAGFAFARITFGPAANASPAGVASFASVDPEAPITAIAVLPLDDFTEGDAIFARALHEEIIAQLAGMTSLRVVSRTSAERYTDTDKLLPEIAQELGVQAIVEGSVTKPADSDSVRITIQLIHAASDRHLLVRTFQRELKDILRLQQQVALEIVKAIQGEVDGEPEPEPPQIASVDPEAHQAFLMGQMEFERGTTEGLEAAEAHFEHAVEMDSTYSRAFAELAGTRVLLGLEKQAPLEEILAAVNEDIQRAIALGGAEQEARAIAVIIQDHLAEVPDEMRAELGMSADESDSFSRTYVENFTQLGSRARAIISAQDRGERTGRGSRARMFDAQRLVADGEFQSAAALLEDIVAEEPGLLPAWEALERTHVLQEDYPRAVEIRKGRILAIQGDTPEAHERIASLMRSFDPEDSSTYWQWLRQDHAAKQGSGEYASDVEYAAACVSLGDYEDAIDYLETAVEKRDPGLLGLRSDPTWDPLRQDPRFRSITRQIREALALRRPRRP